MILIRLSTVIDGVTVEVEGEANDLTQIREAWETFVISTYQVEHRESPHSFKDLDIHEQNLTNPPIVEVL